RVRLHDEEGRAAKNVRREGLAIGMAEGGAAHRRTPHEGSGKPAAYIRPSLAGGWGCPGRHRYVDGLDDGSGASEVLTSSHPAPNRVRREDHRTARYYLRSASLSISAAGAA